jgi:hypothetical protein
MGSLFATYGDVVNCTLGVAVALRAKNTPPIYKYINNQIVSKYIAIYTWRYCFS